MKIWMIYEFKPPSFGKKVEVAKIVGIVCAVLALAFLILIFMWKKYHNRDNGVNLRDIDPKIRVFSKQEIIDATRNFDSTNKLGEGGFGAVYKGQLVDGTIVAVKRLSSKSKQGNAEFLSEIGTISTLLHDNLVQLHGFCAQGNELCLVYEYMANNSLSHALSDEDDKAKLTWPVRLNICMGLARGLVYLHEEAVLRIIHRDIKPSNVLLDENFNAKISDFGIAKVNDVKKSDVTTNIVGTRTYMAPEYYMGGRLTSMADVYSFGFVMLEIVSGKSINYTFPESPDTDLFDWANLLKAAGGNHLLQLVDPDLGSVYSSEEALTVINVALLCSSFATILRPTMSQAVDMLEGRTNIKEFQRISSQNQILQSTQMLMAIRGTNALTSPAVTESSSVTDTECSITELSCETNRFTQIQIQIRDPNQPSTSIG